jgi:peptidoglycan/LPS O-acetylase OafA/YrhL
MGTRLSVLAAGDANNFRIIRLFAASAVILSHGYIVNGGYSAIAQDLLERLTSVDSGEFAVDIFFVTSGFLVARSLLQRRSVRDFLLSRVLRITPALTVAVLVAAFVVGPATTELPLATYFRTRIVYSYVVIDALSISPFHFRYALPGVFMHQPVPGVINAPLWTLPWEIWMYGALLLLFLARGLGKAFPLVFGLILFTYTLMALGVVDLGTNGAIAARFAAFFFAGVAMDRYAPRIVVSLPMLAAITAVFVAVSVATRSAVLLPEWLAYAVLFVAYAPALVIRRWSTGPDLSYGMYIYAYMIQQLLVWSMGPHAPLLNAGLTLVLTLPVAAASWYGIEAPALALKARLRASMRRSAFLPAEARPAGPLGIS